MSDEVANPAVPPVPAVPAPAGDPARRRFATGFTSLRDLLSFLAGVSIIGHEVFFSGRVEVSFLTVGVALAGLPVAFGADSRSKKP